MATTITDRRMTSDVTSHTAFRWEEDGVDGWAVTYLPGIFTRNQAITAMTIVEFYRADGQTIDGQHAPFLRNWAAELGVTVEQIHEELQGNC